MHYWNQINWDPDIRGLAEKYFKLKYAGGQHKRGSWKFQLNG